ncbi:SH2 domain-containing protein 3C isoform X1 [Zootoca vivipara]|uniref:SH2 domain-containing protein 3C isoform X1 n=1 Tax=Zootoca vivipara TaxID=8524 RepID=UPI00293BE9A0|nr:SH2 domain-containing protein 3C isoform X1 [Zootoca vivipara]
MAESQKKGGGFKKLFRFKGFGSLSNIPRTFTLRRVSVAPSAPQAPGGGLLSSNGFLATTIESTQDDLNTVPKSPSPYARSCDMYSHMGTMPRGSSRKSKAKAKDKGTPKEKDQDAGSQTGLPSFPHKNSPIVAKEAKQKQKLPPSKADQSQVHIQYVRPITLLNSSNSFPEHRQVSAAGPPKKTVRRKEDSIHVPGKSSFKRAQDDLNPAPKSPSPHARSCDMSSHVGTLPRSSSGKLKEKAKGKGAPQEAEPPTAPEPSLIAVAPSPGKDAPMIAEDAEQKAKMPPSEPKHSSQTMRQAVSINTSDSFLEPRQTPEGPKEKTKRNKQDSPHVPRKLTSETVQDDLNIVPKSPSPYACSCDMYSHMGTLPRANSGCSRRQPKEESVRCEQDSVQVPRKAAKGHAIMEAPKEPILSGGRAPGEETLQEYLDERHQDGMGSCSEYVKFSKEKYILDSSPEKLHKELEEELKLSSTDLRSHAWYHGRIPREVSESLIQRNGDFLIRDSLTSLGDYVLTCRWRNEPLHFKINKVMVKSSEGRTHIQYLFEQESFDNVPALVRFYVGNRKPISEQSGAIFYCPINRTFPLRYLEASYGLSNGKHSGSHSHSGQKGGHIKRRSITMTDGLTADKITRGDGCPTSVSLPHHRDIIRNCAVSVDQIQDLHSSMSPISESPATAAYSTVTRLKPQTGQTGSGITPSSPVIRRSSEPQLCQGNGSKADQSDSPHSTPSHGYSRASPSPSVSSYSDPDTGHYCQLHPPSPVQWDRPTAEGKQMPAKSYVERLKGDEGQRGLALNGSDVEVGPRKRLDLNTVGFVVPVVERTSSFNPAIFQSLLIPLENKPLEMAVLKKVKELLAEVDAKTLAKHITQVDCLVARILGVTKEMQRLMGVSSGMELLTLPHGHQLRLDLLERFHTMTIMIAVDILGCTGSMEERASLLHKTIQLAAELKSTMGNMFSFAAVMDALEMTQISRLEQTWMVLRQRHTEGAILYEKKLKPFLKSLNEGKEGPPLSNTTFPHIVPLITLLERDAAVPENPEPWENLDSGVEVVMAHLEAARMVAHHGGLYHTNAEMKLQGFQPQPELLEIFSTEFQLRLLWGSRGAESSQSERYEKFNKVLTALSHKLEPAVRSSEL